MSDKENPMTDEKMRAALAVLLKASDAFALERSVSARRRFDLARMRAEKALASAPVDQDEARCSTCGQTNAALVCSNGFHAMPATGDGAEDVVEATIDRMIDAGVKSDGWPGLPRDVLRALARAALATAVVPGMVMVPREPTDEQVHAIICRIRERAIGHAHYYDGREVYRAMIAAVPTPEGE